MALITCPDCGKNISDAAKSCIHCGRPMDVIEKSRDTAFITRDTAFIIDDYIKPIPTGQNTQPKINREIKIVVTIILMFIIMFAMVVNSINKSQQAEVDAFNAAQKLEADRFNALTPEQQQLETKEKQKQADIAAKQAEEKRIKDEFLAIANNKTLILVEQIKASTRNPDTFKVISATYTDKGASCVKYRGQNGFGGYSVEYAVMVKDKISTNNPSRWNKHCANQTGYVAQ